jgi:hypothetical protein
LTVRLAEQTTVLREGKTAVVEPGLWHDWWNASDRHDARVRVEVTPLALFAQEFSDVIEFRSPPLAVQRTLFAALTPIAHWRGYRQHIRSSLARFWRHGTSGCAFTLRFRAAQRDVSSWPTASNIAVQANFSFQVNCRNRWRAYQWRERRLNGGGTVDDEPSLGSLDGSISQLRWCQPDRSVLWPNADMEYDEAEHEVGIEDAARRGRLECNSVNKQRRPSIARLAL